MCLYLELCNRRSRESFLWNEMIPGLGLGSVDIPAIPLPTMEEKVPHCKTTVTFVQSVFHSLEEHIISPELLGMMILYLHAQS